MQDIVDALADQQAELAGLLEGLDAVRLGAAVAVRGLVGRGRRASSRADERDGDRQRAGPLPRCSNS